MFRTSIWSSAEEENAQRYTPPGEIDCRFLGGDRDCRFLGGDRAKNRQSISPGGE